MRIFLAGGESRRWLYTASERKDMQLFLAGTGLWRYVETTFKEAKPYILESFYYAKSDDIQKYLPLFGDFLLDSGAFTFMQSTKSHVNWDQYIEQYADFINQNNIKKFFELDIDSVVGYEKVLEYRKRLEHLTNKQVIPVWHTNRGQDGFIRMCEEYPYVAIGGLVGTGSTEYARKYWNAFPWFIQTAHKNNAKIHALGFTSLDGIKKYHFDSVDSTAWTTGNRFGYLYKFRDGNMKKIDVPKGKRLASAEITALNNFIEWHKFQRYADTHL